MGSEYLQKTQLKSNRVKDSDIDAYVGTSENPALNDFIYLSWEDDEYCYAEQYLDPKQSIHLMQLIAHKYGFTIN